jgi:hypothetical protein
MYDSQLALEDLVEQKIKEIHAHEPFIRRLWNHLFQVVSALPRAEIQHDWLVVNAFAERAVEHIKAKEDKKEVKYREKQTLATVCAYLILAKRERDCAQAWSYVNLADALLPLVVEETELDACTVRLSTCEEHMPVKMKNCLKKIYKVSNKIEIGKKRSGIYGVQTTRALLWNILNRRTSLKLALWRSLGGWLFLGLMLAIVVSEFAYCHSGEIVSFIPYPFAAIALLGFFGGGLSALLKAREKTIRIHSYELIRVQTSLRMLLGAAGALVIFIAAQWLNIANVKAILSSDIFVFLAIGIAGGFSENLFVSAIEKIAENLEISSVAAEEEEGS